MVYLGYAKLCGVDWISPFSFQTKACVKVVWIPVLMPLFLHKWRYTVADVLFVPAAAVLG